MNAGSHPVVAAIACAVIAACGGGPDLETRTFELEHIEADEAAGIVEPYVYRDREENPGELSPFPGGITVRETADNLAKIERVLDRFDRASPGVRLRFQIIEADGDTLTDPRIAEVESTLRELFRYDGYRLVAETRMGAVERSRSSQIVKEGGESFGIIAEVGNVASGQGAVDLVVALQTRSEQILETSMRVPVGKTVVLGSARPDPERGALILTVRPELVPPSEEPPSESEDAGG